MKPELNDEALNRVTGGAYSYYTIQIGDTLENLSVVLGVSVETLIALNGIKNPDLICPGQRLKYPAAN